MCRSGGAAAAMIHVNLEFNSKCTSFSLGYPYIMVNKAVQCMAKQQVALDATSLGPVFAVP